MKKRIGTLQVIFKVVERCNLNCSYCYYYTEANADSDLRPPVISKKNVSAVADFLAESCDEYDIKSVSVVFHGGEPTLLKPVVAGWSCQHLVERLGHLTNLTFSLQTNGVHLSEAWIALIEKYKIGVGVSIDGNKQFNDIYRLDHQGQGSHDRIAETIKRLAEGVHENHIKPVGTISVLNHQFDYRDIYRHLTGDLGIAYMTFLLPDANWDSPPENIDRYGEILSDIFDEWLDGGQGKVRIRLFEEFLANFKANVTRFQFSPNYVVNQIIVIHSDGHIAIDDTFMPAMEWYKGLSTNHVTKTSLKEWLSQDVYGEIRRARDSVPSECRECRWVGICRGGDIENRFSKSSEFNRKSIYCGALMKFYDHVAEVLLEGGYPQEKMDRILRSAKMHVLDLTA